MSGWKTVEVKNVKMIHHSTASVIEIQIQTEDEISNNIQEQMIIFDYRTFENLKEAINKVDFPS